MMSTQLLSLTDTVSMTMLDSNRITSKTRFFSPRNHLINIKIERFFTSILLEDGKEQHQSTYLDPTNSILSEFLRILYAEMREEPTW